MNKDEKKVLCTCIMVDCVRNDKQDIKCGGPQFLGYDFYVRIEETKEIITFIKKTMNELGVPLINIRLQKDVMKKESSIWTKERIKSCIVNNEAEIPYECFEKTLS